MERAISMSPVKGNQGGPEVELSSQEELHQKVNQDIDWELIQKEDEQEAELSEVAVDTVSGNDNTKVSLQENSGDQNIYPKETSQLEVMIEEGQTTIMSGPAE